MLLYKRKEEVHNMNESKRLLIFFISIVLVVAVILVIAFWPEADTTFVCGVKADKDYSKLGSVNYKQYECLVEQDKKFALAISDGLSDDEKKILNEAAEKINVGVYYLSDEISNTDLKKIKKDLKTDKISYNDYSLVVVEDGKVTDGMDKKLDSSDDIYSFLKEAGIAKFACNATSDKEYENLSKLTYDQYDCLYNSDEPFVVIFTASTCHYCEEFLPIVNEYAGKNNLPIYFLEVDTMNQNDVQKVFNSLSYFSENADDWGTPLTLAVKNKKVVTQINGYTNDTTTLDALFKEIGLK